MCVSHQGQGRRRGCNTAWLAGGRFDPLFFPLNSPRSPPPSHSLPSHTLTRPVDAGDRAGVGGAADVEARAGAA